MSKEELIEYLDARTYCNLNFFTVHSNACVSFSRSITKTMEGQYIVQLGDTTFDFMDVRMAAACFVKMLGVAA